MPWDISDVEGFRKGLSRKQKKKWVAIANGALESCMEGGGDEKDCAARAVRIANSKFEEGFNPVITKSVGNILKSRLKDFQRRKSTPPDPVDGHTHEAAFDENGNGGTDMAGTPAHAHLVFHFYLEPYYHYDPDTGDSYTSVHPGSLAFGEVCEIPEMEIFRAGTHNGDEFKEADLAEIAENFKRLRTEVRPKLKITHHGEEKEQIALAGLASYGDIVDVFLKEDGDGEKRLYARVVNVPREVANWIAEGRFSERSIEIYPKFKLGTAKDSPVFNNVLKAVALLGHEMPAVPGMAPVRLSEFHESQGTMCFRGFCVPCEDWMNASNSVMAFENELRINGII